MGTGVDFCLDRENGIPRNGKIKLALMGLSKGETTNYIIFSRF